MGTRGPRPPAVIRGSLPVPTSGPLVALLQRFDRKLAARGEWGRISTVEVAMRPPEVFVRPLGHEEAVTLKRRAKQAKHFSTRERAAILLASNVGNSVPQIAAMWMTDEHQCAA